MNLFKKRIAPAAEPDQTPADATAQAPAAQPVPAPAQRPAAPASRGVTRRGFMRLVIAGAGAAASAAAFHADPESAWADENDAATAAADAAYPNELKVAILSDVHYMSHKLFGENDAFHSAENSDRKLFRQSADILTAALAKAEAWKPNAIFVSGDLTKDGEHVCHQEVHDKLIAAAKNSAKDCVVRVINGNHDINNFKDGKDFSSGTAEDTANSKSLHASEFRKLYHDCGYDDAGDNLFINDSRYVKPEAGHDATAGAVSYVTRFEAPDKSGAAVTLICVDSCRYAYDITDTGTDEHETHGRIPGVPGAVDEGEGVGNTVAWSKDGKPTRLLAWVLDQARAAKAKGDVVIVMQHHGIIAHFGQEPTILADYLVENYDAVAKYYADAGVSCVLTGHMHANDVAAAHFDDLDGKPTIYDIETCATVTYPSDIRFLTIRFGKGADGKTAAALEFASQRVGEVTYTLTDPKTGQLAPMDDVSLDQPGEAKIADITAFGKSRLLSLKLLQNLIKVYGSQAVDYVEADPAKGPYFIESMKIPGGGVKNLIASMAGSLLAPSAGEGGAAGGAGSGSGAAEAPEIKPEQLNAALFAYLGKSLTDAGHVDVASGLQMKVDFGSAAFLVGEGISVYFDAAANAIKVENVKTVNAAAAAQTAVVSRDLQVMAASIADEAEAQGYYNPRARAGATANFTMTAAGTAANNGPSFDKFLNVVWAKVDAALKDGKTDLLAAIIRIAGDACNAKLAGDDAHDLLGTINYAYGAHLYGDENRDPWVSTALTNMAKDGTDGNATAPSNVKTDGSLISFVRTAVDGSDADAGKGTGEDVLAFLKRIDGFDLKDNLVTVSSTAPLGMGGLVTSAVNSYLDKITDARYVVENFLIKDQPNGTKGTLGLAIPNIPALPGYVVPILETLTRDVNVCDPGAAPNGTPDASAAKQGDHTFAFLAGVAGAARTVTITRADGQTIGADGITLKAGEKVTLAAGLSGAVLPFAAYKGQWESENPQVATVNADTGEVTGVAEGATRVTALLDGMVGAVKVTVSGKALPAAPVADILNVDFRRRSPKDWAKGHALNRSHYSGGSRMDKTLRQPVAMMDGKGGLGYTLTEADYSAMQGGFAMELLFRVPSTPSGVHSLFDNLQTDGMGLYLDGAALTFGVENGSGDSLKTVVANIKTGSWIHVVAVNDNAGKNGAASMTLYLNGSANPVVAPGAQAVGSQETANTIYIGAETSFQNGAPETPAVRNTAIAFARLYGKPLTADEVEALYQKSGLAGK